MDNIVYKNGVSLCERCDFLREGVCEGVPCEWVSGVHLREGQKTRT